jgi:iron complex outermembrane recepter protein
MRHLPENGWDGRAGRALQPTIFRRGAAHVLCALLLAAPSAVIAQTSGVGSGSDASSDARSGELGEVVVTARKRDEDLVTVPVAINAIGPADIARYDAATLTEIGELVPQVIIAKSGGGGAGASFSIRGVGSSPLDAGIDQTVTLNVDGMQISRGRLLTQSFFDIAQVEVLKGPQALFFGKNSPGGVISLNSFGATADLEVYAQQGYEFNADQRITEGAISGPITDTLGVRVAVRASDMDGYITNEAEPLANPGDPDHPSGGAAHLSNPGTEEVIGRITIEWHPLDSLAAVLKVLGSKESDNGETSGTELLCSGKPQTLDLLSGTYVTDPNGSCILNGRSSVGAYPPSLAADFPNSNGGVPYTNYHSVVTSLKLDYRRENIAWTSVTGYYSYDNQGFDNFSYTAAPGIYGFNLDHSDGLSQEIRAITSFKEPVNFAYGIYYESSGRQTIGEDSVALVPPDPRDNQTNNYTLLSHNRGETYSAFGQIIYDFLPEWELAAGARWTEDHSDLTIGDSFVNQFFAPFGLVSTEGTFTSGDYRGTNWSPEATLSYHPVENATLYSAYKTGYKNGGFSNPSILSAGQTAAILEFKPEKAHGGELGYKQAIAGGRVRLSSALYDYTFDDLQLNSFVPNPPSYLVRNAAAARTTGVEFDSTFQPNESLGLRLMGGYNRAKYLSFSGACYPDQSVAEGCAVNGTQNLSGAALVRAPRLNITAGADYERNLTERIQAGGSLDVDYTSGYWMQEDENPVSWQGGFYRLNASLRVHERKNRWEVAFIGRNLNNKYYGINSFDAPFGPPTQIGVTIGRPREYILQGTVRFGARERGGV